MPAININNPDIKYGILYVDPPWMYTTDMPGGHRSTDHYPSMSNKQLLDMKVNIERCINKDCLMFMWTTGPMLDFAIELGLGWGFKYRQVAFVWNKNRVVTGNYTVTQCEFCLVFKKGKFPEKRAITNIRQYVEDKWEKHSKKPDSIRDSISRMFPTCNKLELFARDYYKGWDCWGNEV